MQISDSAKHPIQQNYWPASMQIKPVSISMVQLGINQ